MIPLSLLTNKNVLHVLNNSKNNRELFNKNNQVAWIADDSKTWDKFLAVFNIADGETNEANINISLKEIGIANAKITDLWTGKTIGTFSNTFSPEIKPHACGFYRISQVNK
jgi:alpha-galactosidase